ncbi:MAG: DUF2029 domain-containing protein [Actinobacteria bacterium]|nr:DUF2029 domain-containing protein [Actinomycetota bacterium]
MALGAGAFVVRLPALFAARHLTFDDGVFGASAVAMRHGGAPFREVFSSQGPLFLPLVWLGDLAGLRSQNAPRLLAVAAGIGVTILVYVIARRLALSEATSAAAAVVVSISGSVLWTTAPVAADGPGLALALGAVAVALSHRRQPTAGKALAIGALIGAAFAIKSLFAVPPGLAIAWVLLEQRDWRRLALGVGAAAAVILAAALPWGLASVWDQAVDYHLDAAGERTPGRNASKVLSTLWDRDLLALALGAAGLAGVAWAALRRRRSIEAGGPIAAWLAGAIVILVVEHPLWRPHLAHVIAPLVLFGVLALRSHSRVVIPALALLAVGQVATNTDILWPRGYEGAEAHAAVAIEALPVGAFALSDEPGFLWRAGVLTTDDMVDSSILRIESGRVTASSVAREAADPRVCAVLVWTRRFGDFDLPDRLGVSSYVVTEEFGHGRLLLTRPPCS